MASFNNKYLMDYEDTGDFGGDAVDQNAALANIISPPAPPAKPAGPSQAAINALKAQILAQGTSSKWTGQGKGSAEANAEDMATILAGIGITDIKQFGKVTQTIPGYTNITEAGEEVVPEQTIETYGNKLTGQAVPNTYSERQNGNAWGGTFTGSGNTGYRVQFGPDGTPYFYTTKASSNDLANIMQDLGPVFQIGMALATGGLSIPQQIAANMAVQIMSGQDVGTAIKNAAVNMAIANIPGTDLMKEANKFITDMNLDATTTGLIKNSFNNAAISGTKALLTGQDIGDAMLAGAATGGVNGAVNAMLNSSGMQDLTKDLTATQKRLVANAATGLISGKPLDQVLINSAIAAATAEAKEQAKYKSLSEKDLALLTPEEKKEYDEGGPRALIKYQDAENAREKAAKAEADRVAAEEAKAEEIRVTAQKAAEEAARVEAENARKAKEVEDARVAKQVEDARIAKEAADKAAEDARLAKEASDKAAAEAKNLKDAEDARIAKAEADRLAKVAKDAEDARLAREEEVRVTAAREEAARVEAENIKKAKDAEDARVAKEIETARLAKEAKDAEDARLAKAAKDAEDARLAKEAKDAEDARLAKEAKDAEDARLAKEAKDAEDARLAKEEEVRITAERDAAAAEAARVEAENLKKAKDAEDARIAKEVEDARIAREAELEALARQAVLDSQAAENARLAKEAEAKAKADAEAAAAAEAAKKAAMPKVEVTDKKETTNIEDFLDLNNPAGKSTDPDLVGKGTTGTPTIPDAGTVNVKGSADTCPVGTYYDPITNSCEKVVDTTATTPSTPDRGVTPVSKGEVVVTAPRCEAGFVYDELLQACVPIERIDSKPITGEADPTKVTDQGTVKVVGKKETCPTGTVLNEITGECDPAWDEGGGETCPTGQMLDPNTGMCVPVKDEGSVTVIGNRETCPVGTILNPVTGDCDPVTASTTTTPNTTPTTCPAGQTWDAAQSKCVPVASTGGGGGGGGSPVVKKPAVSTTPSFTPSLTAGSTSQETIDPFYAGEMGDFNLFATLDDILADQSGKKDSTKSKDKTKMASGGHLDDLLAQQMTVDDLLNLLR